MSDADRQSQRIISIADRLMIKASLTRLDETPFQKWDCEMLRSNLNFSLSLFLVSQFGTISLTYLLEKLLECLL